MIKERVQDFSVNLSPMVPCWMPSSRGREAARLRWQLGGEETPCCFVSEVRWLPQQKFSICSNLSATTFPNGILSNPNVLVCFLNYPSLIFWIGCTQEDKTNNPCFYNGFYKCRIGIFHLLCIKKILFSIFSTFFLVMGNSISSKENNTLMLGSLEAGELIPEHHYFDKSSKVLVLVEEEPWLVNALQEMSPEGHLVFLRYFYPVLRHWL